MSTVTSGSDRRPDTSGPDRGPDGRPDRRRERQPGATSPQAPDAPSGHHAAARDGGGGHRTVTSWVQLPGPVLAVTALVALVVAALAWPLAQAAPRDVPLAVAAPGPVAAQLQDRLAARAGDGAFEVTLVSDRAAAEQQVVERSTSGALVVSPDRQAEVIVASGGGPALAGVLGELAAAVPPEAGGPARVTDVAPLTEDDPMGAGLTAAALALIIGGIVTGAVLSRAVRGRTLQVTGLLLTASLAGLTAAWLLHGWLGVLPGDYWPVAGVLVLGTGAVAAAVLGCSRALGLGGIGLVALTLVLLGNPLSGAAVPAPMLPAGWGELGQLLPPGATVTALRSVAWFDGAGATQAWWVLSAWLLGGLALWAVPRWPRPARS